MFCFMVLALWSQRKYLLNEIWFLLDLVFKLASPTCYKCDPILLPLGLYHPLPAPQGPHRLPSPCSLPERDLLLCWQPRPAGSPGSKERAYSINHHSSILAYSHCKSSGRLGRLCGFYLFVTSSAAWGTDSS